MYSVVHAWSLIKFSSLAKIAIPLFSSRCNKNRSCSQVSAQGPLMSFSPTVPGTGGTTVALARCIKDLNEWYNKPSLSPPPCRAKWATSASNVLLVGSFIVAALAFSSLRSAYDDVISSMVVNCRVFTPTPPPPPPPPPTITLMLGVWSFKSNNLVRILALHVRRRQHLHERWSAQVLSLWHLKPPTTSTLPPHRSPATSLAAMFA